MQPQQPTSTTPPDLDFILQSTPPKPRRFRTSNSKAQRTLTIIIAGIVLIVLIFVFMSVIQAKNRRGSAELIDLAAYQTELVRVAEIGVKNSVNTNVRGSAQTSYLTILSDLIKTKKMISSLDVKLVETDLSKYKTESNDAKLEEARTANDFDSVYSSLFDDKLVSYEERLADVFMAQSNTKIKNTIRVFNAHAELLPFNYSSAQ